MASLIALSWAWGRYQQQRAALTRLEERQRIADDLHDKVAQILFAAQMQLDCIIEDATVAEENRSQAALARALLIRGDNAIREVIAKISRPLATGLPDRLYEVVEGIDEEFRVPVYLEISDEAVEAGRRAPRAAGDTLVRVAREALVNTAKHAGPCRASVTLDVPAADRLRLRVADTGTGNAVRRGAESHGLTSLRRSVRRHGGSLRVTRGKAGGTVVTVSLPI
jgi:signal transduction histidine kinase